MHSDETFKHLYNFKPFTNGTTNIKITNVQLP